jgi:integrase/recombinase XerD
MISREMQPELDWLSSLGNHSTRRIYKTAVEEFMRFTSIAGSEEFRTVTRMHVMARREHMIRHGLGRGTVRCRLAALSSFFEYLCENDIIACNPVNEVKRPKNFPSAKEAQDAFDADYESASEGKPIWMYIDYG